MKKKISLIFGITGQDGAYLARYLLSKNYIVHGVKRRSSSLNTERLNDIYVDPHNKTNFYLHYGDIADSTSVLKIISDIKDFMLYSGFHLSSFFANFESPSKDSTSVGLK